MLELAAAEEVGEGVVQVTQGFLGRALGHPVHPGHVRLLERVEFAVQVDGGWTLAGRMIGFLLTGQAPVVRPARRARMLATRGDLLVVQIKLGFVGALDGAHACSACSKSAVRYP